MHNHTLHDYFKMHRTAPVENQTARIPFQFLIAVVMLVQRNIPTNAKRLLYLRDILQQLMGTCLRCTYLILLIIGTTHYCGAEQSPIRLGVATLLNTNSSVASIQMQASRISLYRVSTGAQDLLNCDAAIVPNGFYLRIIGDLYNRRLKRVLTNDIRYIFAESPSNYWSVNAENVFLAEPKLNKDGTPSTGMQATNSRRHSRLLRSLISPGFAFAEPGSIKWISASKFECRVRYGHTEEALGEIVASAENAFEVVTRLVNPRIKSASPFCKARVSISSLSQDACTFEATYKYNHTILQSNTNKVEEWEERVIATCSGITLDTTPQGGFTPEQITNGVMDISRLIVISNSARYNISPKGTMEAIDEGNANGRGSPRLLRFIALLSCFATLLALSLFWFAKKRRN
jgi:hypothetical protein